MTRKKAPTDVFDPEAFGLALKRRRKEQGYRSVPKLCEAIENLTGVHIDPDTLYKIERGEREPDMTKLVAICITLYGVSWRTKLGYLLNESVPDKYRNGGLSDERAATAIQTLLSQISLDEVEEF